MSEEILKTRVYKDSRTVKIMDEFESEDDNLKKKYSSLDSFKEFTYYLVGAFIS